MGTLNERIADLEQQVQVLTHFVRMTMEEISSKSKAPVSIVGGGRDRSLIRPVDIGWGRGQFNGGNMVWNNLEAQQPPFGVEITLPANINEVTGYSKHSHSRISGGALINGVVEVVEYDWSGLTNKHCQQFFPFQPAIVKDINSKGESVEKIGTLNLVFNPNTLSWGLPATEIDVRNCYLVERVTEVTAANPTIGAIKIDEAGNEMKSSLYDDDATKSSIIWDKTAKCFRFFAVYSPGDEGVEA